MAQIKTDAIFQLWTSKEQRENRRITATEVSEKTGLSPDTIRKLRANATTRFDVSVLIALCRFFDVPAGPVPFIVFAPDSKDSETSRIAIGEY